MDAVVQLNSALQGRYDIDREIGAGGMATVYLARDIKHDRRVALKVLKPELGAVLGVERFLAEIKVTANLQHPNLLPLFDSGEAGGQLFYVMPFVEGESLRARLDREKQLPVDEAIRIATAVASALDYAHRRNVIHRDLKPENILLHEGQPVVADFGIALAVSNAGGGRITQTGLSLGTPAYMSPEQATGDRAIDGRTDIYSLGAMTFEMLVGDPPHIASTSQAIIAKVLTERPASVRVSRPNVPEYVAAAIEHALEKLPADRFATAREFADAITGKAIVASSATAAGATAGSLPRLRGRRAWIAVGGAALVWAGTLVAIGLIARRAPDAPQARFEIAASPGANMLGFVPTFFAVSPDGRYIAHVEGVAGGATGAPLSIRPIASTTSRTLPGTEGAGFPFWSPDSRYIAYFTPDRRLFKVDVTGGAPQRLAEMGVGVSGGTWNRDNVILVATTTGMVTVPANAGPPVKLAIPGISGMTPRFPRFLPDGRHFLVSLREPAGTKSGVYVCSVDGGAATRVVQGTYSAAAYDGSEFILFARDGDLFAQRFSARGVRTDGEPIHVASDVLFNPANGQAAFSVSANGVLAYRTGYGNAPVSELRWYSRDGKVMGVAGDTGVYSQVRLSPDEKRVALLRLDVASGKSDVWTVDLASNIQSRLTFDTARVADPAWTADGHAVAYYSARNGKTDFYQARIGATGDSLVYASSDPVKYPEDISADGRYFLYHRGNSQLMAVSLTGDHKVLALGDSAFRKDEGRFSPDGQWVLYGSLESGTWEVRVAAFPAFDHQRPVSAHGGRQGRWRADGKELFYLSPDGKVMSVAVKGSGATAEFAAPVELFQSPLKAPGVNVPQFDVSRDGRRFLVLTPKHEDAAAVNPLTVVLNWRSGMKQ